MHYDMWSFEWKRICVGFWWFVYVWIKINLNQHCRSKYQDERFEISLISLTPPHLCAILEQWHGFLRSYVVAFIILRVLRWEMVVWFVDVCGIVDHHFLIFLFIFYNIKVVELNLIWVSFCNVRYDFRIKTNFGSSLPPDVCRRAHVLFTLIVCVCT